MSRRSTTPPPVKIVIANQKGGAGKTATTSYLATAAHRAGAGPVVVIDADPQRQAVDWDTQAGGFGFDVVATRERHTAADIETEAARYRLAFVDCPAGVGRGNITAAAIAAGDIVLCPCAPRAADVAVAVETWELAAEMGKPVLVLLTMTDPRWKAHREFVTHVSADSRVRLLDTAIQRLQRIPDGYGEPIGEDLCGFDRAWAEISVYLNDMNEGRA